MELRDKSKIRYWADKYKRECNSDILKLEKELLQLKFDIRKRDYLYLTKDELKKVIKWKLCTQPGRKTMNLNRLETKSNNYIKCITSDALTITNDYLSFKKLTNLIPGVGDAIGSTILHFFHSKRYPIWDFRARWSIQLGINHITIKGWKDYVCFCRKTAEKYKVCMRTLDRALWQYSKENQK